MDACGPVSRQRRRSQRSRGQGGGETQEEEESLGADHEPANHVGATGLGVDGHRRRHVPDGIPERREEAGLASEAN
jgi:hypothetical protein